MNAAISLLSMHAETCRHNAGLEQNPEQRRLDLENAAAYEKAIKQLGG